MRLLPPSTLPLAAAAAAAIISTSAAAAPPPPPTTTAPPLYTLDAGWPAIPPSFNLSGITAVAVANSTAAGVREVHVAQRGTGAPPVLVFDPATGDLLRTWGAGVVVTPHGLAAAPGAVPSPLWLTDVGDATVKCFNVSGGLISVLGTPGGPGSGVNPPQFSPPADTAAVTPTGALAVTDGDGGSNNRMLVFKYDSGSPGTWELAYGVGGNGSGPGLFNSPHSVAYDAAWDRWWVADRYNNRLQVFLAADGMWVGEWPAATSCFAGGQPWGVRLDVPRNRMFIADGAADAVYVLGVSWGASPYDVGSCTLLQNITLPAGSKPHELGYDAVNGDLYVAGVGTPTIINRWVLQ